MQGPRAGKKEYIAWNKRRAERRENPLPENETEKGGEVVSRPETQDARCERGSVPVCEGNGELLGRKKGQSMERVQEAALAGSSGPRKEEMPPNSEGRRTVT